MSKLIKSLALGTAAAAVVAVSSSAYAFCPREGGYYNDYKSGYYENDYYSHKKLYSEKTEYGAYDKPDVDEDDNDAEDVDADDDDAEGVEEVAEFEEPEFKKPEFKGPEFKKGPEFTKGPGKVEAPEDRKKVVEKKAPGKVVKKEADEEVVEKAEADTDDDGKGEIESALYEIAGKGECDETGCSGLILRDSDGTEIEVRGVSFAEELTKGASREEVAYQLFQNGGAVRGRLVEIEGAGDESTYDFVVERIYS